MKTLIKLLVLIVVVVACVGFYLGWFKLSSSSDEPRPNFSVTVDQEKIEADKDKLMEKLSPDSDSEPDSERDTE